MDLIEDIGALLKAPNTHFSRFYIHEKLLWEDGKNYNFGILDYMVKTVCNNMCCDKKWDSVDPKDAKIIALCT